MNFNEQIRQHFYQVLYARRDVRSEFIDKKIDDDTLMRILTAAHHAPSVGYMQPWDFTIIRSKETRQKIKSEFDLANQAAVALFDEKQQKKYNTLKLEGILESDLGIVITCDRNRAGKVVLGRTNNMDMDIYSTVCAVQNIWLAARAENIGVGWVSIIDYEKLKVILHIPKQLEIVAYLCLGYVSEFNEKPELEQKQWRDRETLNNLIHYEHW